MRVIEIIMRIGAFFMGVLMIFSFKLEVHGTGALELLANAIFLLAHFCYSLVLIIAPWALPFSKKGGSK